MDWAAGNRWRKAMVLSFLFHSLVLIGAGWMAGKALVPVEVPELLLELETMSDSASPSLAAAPDIPPAAQPVPLRQPVQAHTPVAVSEPVVETPVVAVSAMSVTAIDTTAVAAVAGTTGGSGSSEGTGGGGVGSGSGSGTGTGKSADIIPPGILSRKEPSYPEKARQAGLEGTVVLKIQILETGRPGDVSIHQSSGSELLDDAAASAVQRWRFVPAKVRASGQSITCYTTMPVVFKLKA